MAAKAAVVDLDDENTVTVDVTDLPELVDVEPKAVVVEKAAAAVPAPKRQEPPAEAALNEALRKADEGRQAAERQVSEERRRREEAQREAVQKTEEARRAREEAQGHELTIVTNGIDAAKSRQTTAKADFARHMEQGDYDKASDAQTELTQATAELVELNREKGRIESAPKRAPTEGAVKAPAGFDSWVSENFTPRSAAWIRVHPDFAPAELGGDRRKNAAMVSAHWEAQSKGIELESQEYFDLIEQKLGLKEAPEVTTESPMSAAAVTVEAAAKPRRPAPVAAPVSRDAPATPGSRLTRSVTLSPEQREAAKISFPAMSEKDAYANYAKNLLQLESEGKMGRLTH